MVLSLAAAWGCGRGQGEPLAREVSAQLAALGVTPRSVRCAGAECSAELAAGVSVPLALEPRADGVHWRLGAVLVSTAPLERYLAGELAALGLEATPRCGTPFVVLSAPRRLRCGLGAHGVAWVDLQSDGSYSLEVALGAAVAERERGPALSELEARSRQLDGDDSATDEAADEAADDGDGAPDDEAGSGSGAARGLAL